MATAGESTTFMGRLKELDMFFQGKDPVHKTMRRIVKRLEKAKIPYVIVGGMAVFAHEHRRATNDVDVLLTQQGFDEFCRRYVPKNYEQSPKGRRRYIDKTSTISVDFVLTGLYPGRGQPGPIAFPDPSSVRELVDEVYVLDLPTLVQLKLAARRWQDFADVVALIRENNLDESFQDQLHPSVRGDYIECLEEKRREDEYENQP